VTLTSKDTGISAKTTTDSSGEYDFLDVKVGRYTLTVEQTGFAKSTTDVAVDVEARQRVDINLQVGVVSDTVTVNGAAAVLDTDSSEHSQVVPTRRRRRASTQRPQLRRPGAFIHQRRQISHWSLLLSQRYAARGLLQREWHAQHV
jgi:hypothetical protein